MEEGEEEGEGRDFAKVKIGGRRWEKRILRREEGIRFVCFLDLLEGLNTEVDLCVMMSSGDGMIEWNFWI